MLLQGNGVDMLHQDVEHVEGLETTATERPWDDQLRAKNPSEITEAHEELEHTI